MKALDTENSRFLSKNRPLMKLVFLLGLSLASFDAFAQSDCAPAQWAKDPEMVDGSFYGTRSVECELSDVSISSIEEKLSKYIHESPRISLKEKPSKTTLENTPGEKFLVQEKVDDDGSEVKIDAEWILASNKKDKLVYSVDSKSIDAEGMSSYLKNLDLKVEIVASEKHPGKYKMVMLNSVQIERPWFALAPMFHEIAKGKTSDRFESAKETFLKRIAAI